MPLFDGQMIPDFITNALDGKVLEIFGDESFRTSLLYVSDAVAGLRKMMAAPAGLGAVNLGSDLDMKLVDVAQTIIEMTGSTASLQFKPPLLFMSQLGLPDLTKAKEQLGWMPLTTLDNGLKQTIDYTISHKSLLDYQTFADALKKKKI
jgi:nucleoside-diphosphate-sugar epimerase